MTSSCFVELSFGNALDGAFQCEQRVQAGEAGMDPPPGLDGTDLPQGV
nr:MAG TPA: hypothetical protein [Caudoviricetes sp.]